MKLSGVGWTLSICHNLPRMCSNCRNHHSDILFPRLWHYWMRLIIQCVLKTRNMAGATSEYSSAYLKKTKKHRKSPNFWMVCCCSVFSFYVTVLWTCLYFRRLSIFAMAFPSHLWLPNLLLVASHSSQLAKFRTLERE